MPGPSTEPKLSTLCTKPFVISFLLNFRKLTRPERAEALSPGRCPGLLRTQPCRPVRAKALKLQAIYKAFALTGRLADCYYTQGAALGYELLGLQPVLKLHAKVEFFI